MFVFGCFFFSSRRRHTICALVTGVQTCSLPICFRPDILAAVRSAFDAAQRDGDFVRLDKTAFAASPSDSIDYAVMEKTDRAMVLPVDIGWNDVGSWSALWEVSEQDGDGNARHGDVI